jgi:hypothetical protein
MRAGEVATASRGGEERWVKKEAPIRRAAPDIIIARIIITYCYT